MKYRREIDGLRALAVIPVILYHAGFQTVSGGFSGVDVFFVISGYLITSLLLGDLEAGRFSLLDFYERRARRILPALFLVMLVCIPFAWLWLLPSDMRDFATSVATVSAFVGNFLFWHESGYFNTTSEYQPLLHTWSLAVEEQYYLFFPLLLLLAWRTGRRFTLGLFSVLFCASLAAAQWGTDLNTTFYLLPARSWELLLGVFAALSRTKVPAQRLAEAGGLAGLGLIVYAVFAFDRYTPVPSVYTLIPTVGAVLILLCARPGTLAGRVLGHRFLVGIGLISYSAYLWHQPLLAFARHRSLEYPGTLLSGGLAGLALALGYLTWKYVETPFRNRAFLTRGTLFSAFAVTAFLFGLFGLIGYLNGGFLMRHPMFPELATLKTLDDSYCHNKGRRDAEQLAQGDFCVLGAAVAPTLAMVGDSHAGTLFDEFGARVAPGGRSFAAVSGGFCSPLLELRLSLYQDGGCIDTTGRALERIAHTPAITDVVLMAEWANYTKGYRTPVDGAIDRPALASDSAGSAASPLDNPQVFERSLRRTVNLLQRAGKRVTLVGPVPEFHRAVLPRVARIRWFHGDPAYLPVVSAAEYQARNAEVLAAFGRLPGVRFVDVQALFCSTGTCRPVDDQGRILFSDSNHVTQYGARLIADALARVLLPVE